MVYTRFVYIYIYGSYMVDIWLIYGFYMVHIWFIYGSYMVHIWFTYGLCMVYIWFTDGFRKDIYTVYIYNIYPLYSDDVYIYIRIFNVFVYT